MSGASRRRGVAASGRSPRLSPSVRGGGGGGGTIRANPLHIPGVVKARPLPPAHDDEEIRRYLDAPLTPGAKALLNFRLSKQKNKEIQELAQAQADRNRRKVLMRVQKRQKAEEEAAAKGRAVGGGDESGRADRRKKKSKEEYLQELRKCVAKVDIRDIGQDTLDEIAKLTPHSQRQRFPHVLRGLLEEVGESYKASLREGTVNMMIKNDEEEDKERRDQDNRQVKDKCAPWHEDFKRHRRRILRNLHLLHPALRQSLSLCKDHLNAITLADFNCYSGEAIDLDSFCGNFISECEKTEETLMNTWLNEILAVFNALEPTAKIKGERQLRFYQCASVMLSIQLRDLLMRSVDSFVGLFGDRRRLPRIELELVLRQEGDDDDDGGTAQQEQRKKKGGHFHYRIAFSPSLEEVVEMISSVVTEMNKLLREVPTIESWMSDATTDHSFVQVNLDQEFMQMQMSRLHGLLSERLEEPKKYADELSERFKFLISGDARREILSFIGRDPRFEEICGELVRYNALTERTQELSSLEYFEFVRLDCEAVRRGLGDAARTLSNLLLQNVVDTYRRENSRICKEFEKIEHVALNAPKSTKEMIELGEFMLNVKNHQMVELQNEIEESKKHLLYLIDVHIFAQEDIALNTRTLAWPDRIRPVFEQNTEIVEDCKAKFEDNLQKKSEWIVRELEKLSGRVQELEELGDISAIQQYTYEIRLIQSKLRLVEETVCWVNEEEALFKFPQSSYHDVGDITTIQKGEGKMKQNIEPYARLFGTVLKWQKAEKKWTDGSFLELNAASIEQDTSDFAGEMENLQRLFKSKFKQQALDGDSKYAKMNLEDTNPENLPPPLKICALTSAQITAFRLNIPIIQCLCNPGIRQRHWNQMGAVIGFDITPNSGSSLRKVLRLDLGRFMDRLNAISVSATREHGLELTLRGMKEEWGAIDFHTGQVRDSGQRILEGMERIRSHLDDHCTKTQNMRGSPYFKAFEDSGSPVPAEVRSWERQLGRIRELLDEWSRIQTSWLALEAIFSTEDVVVQMPKEANMFKEVDATWKYSMELVCANPNVLRVTQTDGLLELFKERNRTLQVIFQGLETYVEKRRLAFPRFFFLSRKQLMLTLCETRDPSRIQGQMPLLFPGLARLELSEMHEASAFISPMEERMPLVAPVRTREFRGCVEKWMAQVETTMRVSVRELILQSLEALTACAAKMGSSGGAAGGEEGEAECDAVSWREWAQDWPRQALLAAAFVWHTREGAEAIKGGSSALLALLKHFDGHRRAILTILTEELQCDALTRSTVRSLLFQSLSSSDVVRELAAKEVRSEKDFEWRSKPRAAVDADGHLTVEVLHMARSYGYEYLGDCPHPVYTPPLRHQLLGFLAAFRLKQFPLVRGPEWPSPSPGCGKLALVREVTRLLGTLLVVRSAARHFDSSVILRAIQGVAYSGCWLVVHGVDRLPESALSALAPCLLDLKRALLKVDENLEGGEGVAASLGGRVDVAVAHGGFVCFTAAGKQGGVEPNLPSNFLKLIRTVSVVRPDPDVFNRALLMSVGCPVSDQLVAKIVQTIETANRLWKHKDSERALFLSDSRMLIRFYDLLYACLRDDSFRGRPESAVARLLEKHCRRALGREEHDKLRSVLVTVWGKEQFATEEDSPPLGGNVSPRQVEAAFSADDRRLADDAAAERAAGLAAALDPTTDATGCVVLLGGTFTGKTVTLRAAARLAGLDVDPVEEEEGVVGVKSVYPAAYSASQRFGWMSDEEEWRDGVVTGALRELAGSGGGGVRWLVLHGPLDADCLDAVEKALDDRFVDLSSGEHLLLPPASDAAARPGVVFETDDVSRCSPSTLSRCAVFVFHRSDLPWSCIFHAWLKAKPRSQEEERWKGGQEALIRGLFEWLIPLVIRLVESKSAKSSQDLIVTNSLFRYSLELFSTSMTESISGLKEKKYLRSWIQAAFLFSVVWAFGGILSPEERQTFDAVVRDALMGKSPQSPLPAVLNNKFDAVPPTEGALFDFVFDFKGRGQWKHWSDAVKNAADAAVVLDDGQPFVPTVDSVRFAHLQSLVCRQPRGAAQSSRPFLLVGPAGCGKSVTVAAAATLAPAGGGAGVERTRLRFAALRDSDTAEFTQALLRRLHKRRPMTYGLPPMTSSGRAEQRGTLFLDDLHVPEPDWAGRVQLHELIIQLFEEGHWHHPESRELCRLENMDIVGCCSLDSCLHGRPLPPRLVSRCCVLRMDHPPEDALNRFFSTALTKQFKDRNFPPEVTSVIPTLVQSSLKVFSCCQELLTGSGVMLDDVGGGAAEESYSAPSFLGHPPNLRDVFRLVQGCSKMPKESAENKKLFTRLWVHETMRNFYDRLVTEDQRDKLFSEVRSCVKTLFRENFDSAFEHLGKVDGHVTLLNLRNLLFGNYIPDEEGKTHKESFSEVASSDSLEKLVAKSRTTKDHAFSAASLLPNRFSLELISHLSHVLSLPGGHVVVGGRGGVGRRAAARLAASLSGIRVFEIPVNDGYSKAEWRRDLGVLIKGLANVSREGKGSDTAGERDDAGESGDGDGFDVDTALYMTASQLLRQREFLLPDIRSLLVRGEVEGLFTVEEKHEINEHVHQHLLRTSQSGIVSELTPSALYDLFVGICRRRLHLILAYDGDNDAELQLFVENECLTKSAFHVVVQQWPEDALKKSADLVLEDVNLDRNLKKDLVDKAISLYEEARTLSESLRGPGTPNSARLPSLVSPSNFVRCATCLCAILSTRGAQLEQRRALCAAAVARFAEVGRQMDDLRAERTELAPKVREVERLLAEEARRLDGLAVARQERLAQKEEREGRMEDTVAERDRHRADYDGVMGPVEADLKDKRRRVQSLKVSELLMSKTLKSGTPPLRACVTALCILMDVSPDAGKGGNDKKSNKIKLEGADYWSPGKRTMMDPTFLEKLLQVNVYDVLEDRARLIHDDIVCGGDWDVQQAAKSFPPADALCHYVLAICCYHLKKAELKPTTNLIEVASKKAEEQKQEVEESEQELSKIESSIGDASQRHAELQAQLSSKREADELIQERLDRGRRLTEQLSGDLGDAAGQLAGVEASLAAMHVDALAMAFRITVVNSFHPNERGKLRKVLRDTLYAPHEAEAPSDDPIAGNDSSGLDLLLDEACRTRWEEECNLPSSQDFYDNVLAWEWGQSWPYLWDPEGIGLELAVKHFAGSGRSPRMLHAEGLDTGVVRECARQGTVLILCGVRRFDSRLKPLIAKRTVEKDGQTWVDVDGELCRLHPSFRLLLISPPSGPCEETLLDQEFVSYCVFTDFSATEFCLQERFLNTLFEKESPKGFSDLEAICRRVSSASLKLSCKSEDMLGVLAKCEGNLLGQPAVVQSLLETKAAMAELSDARGPLLEARRALREARATYREASAHACVLFMSIQKLQFVSPMYQYSLSWFCKVLKTSIENSNKSRVVEKRLRYIRDHLTYSLFCQITHGLLRKDRLLFAFLLSCQLMVSDGRLDPAYLCAIPPIWNLAQKPPPLTSSDESHPELPWLRLEKWRFFQWLERQFPQFKGLCLDLVESSSFWLTLHDAKEPDNLPLKEPWYSSLSSFFRLILIAALRPDKLLELAHSFVSDHVGFKFVEPVTFDLGRVFSDGRADQPIVTLAPDAEGAEVMACKVRRLAAQRGHRLEVTSLGEEGEGQRAGQEVERLARGGHAWMLLEEFQLERNGDAVLRAHERLDAAFHAGYRLWIITRETKKFPCFPLRTGLKLCSESPGSIREALTHCYGGGGGVESPVKSLLEHWSATQFRHERDHSRLLFCVAFFHSLSLARGRFGARGGLRVGPEAAVAAAGETPGREVEPLDLQMAVYFLKVLGEMDCFSVPALRVLIGECCYVAKSHGELKRSLVRATLSSCLSSKVITTNRFKFSSVSDFYVPNKILYKDYMEYIKGLPEKVESELFELEPVCQIAADLESARRFLLGFSRASAASGLDPRREDEVRGGAAAVARVMRELLAGLEAAAGHEKMQAAADAGGSGRCRCWLWRREVADFVAELNEQCVKLTNALQALQGKKGFGKVERITTTAVRSNLIHFKKGSHGEVVAMTTEDLKSYIKRKLEFLSELDFSLDHPFPAGLTSVPMDLLSRPERVLVDLHLLLTRGEPNWVFRLLPTTAEDVGEETDWVQMGPTLTGLVLQGAGYDYERHMLVPRKSLVAVRSERVTVALTRDLAVDPPSADATAAAVAAGRRRSSASAHPPPAHPTVRCPVFGHHGRAASALVGHLVVRSGLTQSMMHKMAVAFIVGP